MNDRLHASVATNVLRMTQASDLASIAENSSRWSVRMGQPLACAMPARNEPGKKLLEGAKGSMGATIGKELGIMASGMSLFRSSRSMSVIATPVRYAQGSACPKR
jgi:hypothetical protein